MGTDSVPRAADTDQIALDQPVGPHRPSSALSLAEEHLLDYVRIVYKRRWTAITTAIVTVAIVAAYTFTTVPVFQARAQLLIETAGNNVLAFKEVVEDRTSVDYYLTQYKILESRSLARKTIDTLHLWQRLGAAEAEPKRPWVRDAIAAVTQLGIWPQTRPSTSAPAPSETEGESRTIDRFLQGLSIAPIRGSRLVDVRYQSTDPKLAADIANAVARGFIEENLEFKFLASKEATDWLGARLAEQRKKVEASEQALQQYREQNDAMSLEERQNLVVLKLVDLNAAVTKTKTQRIEKETVYEQLRRIQGNRAALDTYPAIMSNGYIQQLRSELTTLQRQQAQLAEKLADRHPDAIKIRGAIQLAEAKLDVEITKVVRSIEVEYRSAAEQERNLVQALDAQKREAQELSRKGVEYGVLQREAATNRQLFDSLMQRAKETSVSEELRTSNVRVIDEAEVPLAPIRPNRRANLFWGSMVALAIGIGFTFFFEYLDNRVKTPAEITNDLGLSFLGMIPLVPRRKSAPMLNNGVSPHFVEAFRSVRTNLLFSLPHERNRSFVVTSAGPGEGKTIASANIALALAQADRRVLLVDGDFRRPSLHRLFDLPQDPGLSNLIVGTAKASEALRSTSVPNLWVLPAGLTPPNPSELLAPERFRSLLETLNQHFEWIVIDSPPLLAVTDAALMGHQATGVVFVLAADKTTRPSARSALDQLSAIDVRIAGAVLNRVDFRHQSYYYSAYYRREYAKYYMKPSAKPSANRP